MDLSRDALCLLREFDDAIRAGREPSVESYLARARNQNERVELLVQLLAAELAYERWNADHIKRRVNQFPEVGADSTNLSRLLRIVYNDRLNEGQKLAWASLKPFGLAPEQARLTYGSEPNFLGQVLDDRYGLEERVGAGRCGVVFRAHDTLGNQSVAIKTGFYPRIPKLATDMICREMEVNQALKHPNIVDVKGLFFDDAGSAYLVMEYLSGGSLLRIIRDAPIEPPKAIQLMLQIASALVFAHAKAIFHRDIKPENVLLDEADCARLCDFGFALQMDEQWDKEGDIRGTYPYMAPELLLGATHQIDGRSDLWSVGVILLELLTGSRLSEEGGREAALVASIVHGRKELELPESVPEPLRPIIARCLRYDPNERYDSVKQFQHALQEVLSCNPKA